MTCAQRLLRLLWGGPEVGVLRDWLTDKLAYKYNTSKVIKQPDSNRKEK